MRVDIAGVNIDAITKIETLKRIAEFLQSDNPHLIVTTYSEFIVFAQRNEKYRQVLNNAALSLPDGFGLLWASKFLSLTKSNRLTELLRLMVTLIRALFDKKYFKTIIPEVITGSRIIWDIANMAQERGHSLALVGGSDSVAAQSAVELKKKFPNLKVNLALSGGVPFDDKTVQEIAHSNSDILLIAYSPPKQEIWLSDNLSKLNVRVAMGVGGTFDYLAGKRLPSPNFMHYMGLEWLWRLITQPWRVGRIWNAVPVFVWIVYKYKLKKNYDQGN